MLNINVGLLGHVDSGKTSLAKAISRTASTAAFDKNPQSQARGITLDLGFSACEVTAEHPLCGQLLKAAQLDSLRCTIIDCPGHSSLIRTMVGGAHITDMIILVIDATKGVQTQTAECLVLAEVLAKPLMVVVNKIDALQGGAKADKDAALARLLRKLKATFARTRWPRVSIVCVAAAPRMTRYSSEEEDGCTEQEQQKHRQQQQREDCNKTISESDRVRDSENTVTYMSAEAVPYRSVSDSCRLPPQPINTESVLPTLLALLDLTRNRGATAHETRRAKQGNDLFMLIDHCFPIRGHGTILTGTVLDGIIRVGDTVALPELPVVRKVRSMQCFHRPVIEARCGDRVGVCVTQLDHTLFERGVLCSAASSTSNRSLPSTTSSSRPSLYDARNVTSGMFPVLIVEMTRIRYYVGVCDSHTRFHIVLGHSTVMATMRYFSRPSTTPHALKTSDLPHDDEVDGVSDAYSFFDLWNTESDYEEELGESAVMDYADETGEALVHAPRTGYPIPLKRNARTYYAVVLLDKPLYARVGQVLLAMRLDSENEHACRIAMAGRVRALLPLYHNADAERCAPRSVGRSSTVSSKAGTVTAAPAVTYMPDVSSMSDGTPLWRMLPVSRYRKRVLCVERVLSDRSCVASGVVTLSEMTQSGAGVATQSGTSLATKLGSASMATVMHAHVQRFIGFKVIFERDWHANRIHDTSGDSNTARMPYSSTSEAHDTSSTIRVNGIIASSFGQSGKVILVFEDAVFEDASQTCETLTDKQNTADARKRSKRAIDNIQCNGVVTMTLKKYPFALHSTLTQ